MEKCFRCKVLLPSTDWSIVMQFFLLLSTPVCKSGGKIQTGLCRVETLNVTAFIGNNLENTLVLFLFVKQYFFFIAFQVCKEGFFQCRKIFQCVEEKNAKNESIRCNAKNDCMDMTDELECTCREYLMANPWVRQKYSFYGESQGYLNKPAFSLIIIGAKLLP